MSGAGERGWALAGPGGGVRTVVVVVDTKLVRLTASTASAARTCKQTVCFREVIVRRCVSRCVERQDSKEVAVKGCVNGQSNDMTVRG